METEAESMTTKEEPRTEVNGSSCPDSPTGAHHWVLGAPSTTMSGRCKYCHAERAFRPFDEPSGFNNSPKKRRGGAEELG